MNELLFDYLSADDTATEQSLGCFDMPHMLRLTERTKSFSVNFGKSERAELRTIPADTNLYGTECATGEFTCRTT
jgi:hypothetical protein